MLKSYKWIGLGHNGLDRNLWKHLSYEHRSAVLISPQSYEITEVTEVSQIVFIKVKPFQIFPQSYKVTKVTGQMQTMIADSVTPFYFHFL